MTVDLSARYPQGVDTGVSGYPHGRPRNESSPGSRDGFPAEVAWISDLWGAVYAVLGAAGITPSNTPDRVGASQLLDAIQTLDAAARAAAVDDAKGLLALQQSVALAHREHAGEFTGQSGPNPHTVLFDHLERILLVGLCGQFHGLQIY